MSLGPPFDESGLRRQLQLGSLVIISLALTVLGIILFSGRTLGRGDRIYVRMHLPGALRVWSKVRLAGRDIGEVRDIVPVRGGVLVEAFVLRDWLPHLHKRSEIFVSSVSILGEAHLEVGPPRDGGDAGPSVAPGDELVATDPPDLDKLLSYTLENSREWMKLIEEARPDVQALMSAGASLMTNIESLPVESKQWGDAVERMFQIFRDTQGLIALLDSAGGGKRILADARDIGRLIDEKSPEVGVILDRFADATDRIAKLDALLSDEQLGKATHAWATLKQTSAAVEAIVADVTYLGNRLRRGKGTLGGLLTDKELWDDLHESHRKLKSQPWTLIKPPK